MIKHLSAILLSLAATSAVAQNGPIGTLQCTGKPVTIRMSIIKPGQLALFKKAVADHQAWYAKNNNATKVAFVRLTQRGAGGALSYDDSAAMTVVTYDTKPQPAHDEGYAAFVKEYQDSSTVKDEHRGCMG
jgi:hypothetical protein